MKNKTAVFYMLYSAIATSLMVGTIKFLDDFSVYQIIFFRATITLFFTFFLLKKFNIPVSGNNKKLLLLRAFLGVFSMTCFFYSIKYLDIGVSVTLRYTSPIFAAIFALFFLKEKIKLLQWFFYFIAFIGVMIIKGFTIEISSVGIFFAMISSLSLGLVFVVTRKIGTKENHLVIINYFMLMAFIFGGIFSIDQWKNPSLIEFVILISSGIFGFIGVFYMTKAFQNTETHKIAPLKYLEVIFTIFIGVLCFEEFYSYWTLLGIILIIIGVVYNLYISKIHNP